MARTLIFYLSRLLYVSRRYVQLSILSRVDGGDTKGVSHGDERLTDTQVSLAAVNPGAPTDLHLEAETAGAPITSAVKRKYGQAGVKSPPATGSTCWLYGMGGSEFGQRNPAEA